MKKLNDEARRGASEPTATLTVDETAAYLRIGRNQAYEAVASGDIPSIRIGKRIIVPRVALERKLAAAAK